MKYDYTFNANSYKTPPVLYKKALDFFKIERFSLDTCCSDFHIPAQLYYINGKIDGLKQDWSYYNWCNPPFNECSKWIKKAFEQQQKGCMTCMLIPARTETKYWHDYILNNPGVRIDWLRKGYKFLDADGNELGIFKNALALVYFLAY